MRFWILVTSTHELMKSTFVSRSSIPTAVCSKCLGRNNWCSPPRSLWATASTIRGGLPLFYSFCPLNYCKYWTVYHCQCGYCMMVLLPILVYNGDSRLTWTVGTRKIELFYVHLVATLHSLTGSWPCAPHLCIGATTRWHQTLSLLV
jgi:hypothetical protein